MSKSTSITQIEANRKNAEKSTGPKTPEGKQVVASNAVKHGLYARQLILNDEDPTEYEALVDGLQAALSPVGALEYALVERIAVALWRQRHQSQPGGKFTALASPIVATAAVAASNPTPGIAPIRWLGGSSLSHWRKRRSM